MMTHIALTSLCKDRLTATAALPITLLPIQNQENPIWQQRLEAVFALEGPHFHAGWLHWLGMHNTCSTTSTARIVMQQCMRLKANKEHTAATSHKLERLRHENAVLRNGAHPPSEQDCELQVTYCRHSEAEHGWNHTRMLLDITREEVDTRSHGNVHLEHHVEM
jgi:hypothetical protein